MINYSVVLIVRIAGLHNNQSNCQVILDGCCNRRTEVDIQKEIEKAKQEQLEGLNPYSENVIVDHVSSGMVVIKRSNYEEYTAELDLVGPFMGDVDRFNLTMGP